MWNGIGTAYDTARRRPINGTITIKDWGIPTTITGTLLFKRGKFEIHFLEVASSEKTYHEIISSYDNCVVDVFDSKHNTMKDYEHAFKSFRSRVKARRTRLAKKLVKLQAEFDEANEAYADITE